MTNPMKILTISGSLQAGSSNAALLRAAAMLAPRGIEVVAYQGLADLPHFNVDLDGDPPPSAVIDLREQLKSADGLLFATPEYVFGMPGSLKNALDWVVGSGELAGKPVAVISASTMASGGDKARASLVQTLQVMSAEVVGELGVGSVRKKFDAQGELADPATLQELEALVMALVTRMARK